MLLLPDFLLIVCGFLVCRFTSLNRPVWDSAERLVYYLLFPVLLFNSILKSPLQPGSTLRLGLTGLAILASGIVLAYALGRVPGIDARRHAAGAQVAFRFNSYVGLALAERLSGAQGLTWMALIVAFCVPLSNIGAVWPLARHGGQPYLRELLRNPLILGTVAGLAANLAGLELPEPLGTGLQRIGLAALPLGLMAVGAGLQTGGIRAGAEARRGAARDPPCRAAAGGAGADRAARPAAEAGGHRARLRRPADGLELLRARRAHGRRRGFRRRSGHDFHARRHGEPAAVAGGARRGVRVLRQDGRLQVVMPARPGVQGEWVVMPGSTRHPGPVHGVAQRAGFRPSPE